MTTYLSNVPGGSEKPYEIAKRVVEERPSFDWFRDRPCQLFGDTEIGEPTIAALTAARKRVGVDLQFLTERLPSPANLPDPTTLLGWHRDLVAARSLTDTITHSEPLTRRVIAGLGLEEAEKLASNLKGLAAMTSALMEKPWARALAERQLTESATMSRVRPTALAFLSEARQFLFAFKLKAHQEVIEQICVSGLPPAGTDDWRHVCIFVAFRDKVMSLSARWITLRDELSIPEEVHFDDARLSALDNPDINAQQLERVWSGLRAKLSELRSLETAFQEITETCAALARAGGSDWSKSAALARAGGSDWSKRLLSEPVTENVDPVIPSAWKAAWNWAAQLSYLERIGAASDLATLHRERLAIEKNRRDEFAKSERSLISPRP